MEVIIRLLRGYKKAVSDAFRRDVSRSLALTWKGCTKLVFEPRGNSGGYTAGRPRPNVFSTKRVEYQHHGTGV